MLTRLELIGFKSFADKTRFDFAPGITAVVGPNGSGKSNVVDAVKWVLGEQSAKALRGGEMADVIFNGSSTRKSLGLAEVSLVFDNRRKHLNTDAEEVQVTRRVYRDGQGEYLINGQLARLKDIRELFVGSGAGHGAYSVIEQGRVDALLTASTKDRRAVFEEAAGISRFKAKKAESLKQLAQVEGDLTRVRDVLQELEKQLRTLRLQAAKAQRHQEYTGRLRELRVDLGVREYRELVEAVSAEEAVLADLRAAAAEAAARTESGDRELAGLDSHLSATLDALRDRASASAAARQTIGATEATAKAETGQLAGLDTELRRLGKQRVDLARRLAALDAEWTATAAELAQVSVAAAEEQARADGTTAALAAVTGRIAELTTQTERDREAQFALVGRAAKLQGEAGGLRSEADRLQRELSRKLTESERTSRQHDALEAVLADLSRTDSDVQQKLAGARKSHDEHLTYRDHLRKQADGLQAELEGQREARSALRGRVEVLEGLQRSFDGIGAGVRAVLDRRAAGDPLLASCVAGLVTDFLAAPNDVAAVIDLALGDAAQRFVVTDPTRMDELALALAELPGRVGLVPFVPPSPGGRGVRGEGESGPGTNGLETGLDSQESPSPLTPNPQGRGEQKLSALVTCDRSDLGGLPELLLGNVFLVPDLAAARRLQADQPAARCVTRAGELLEPDGTVTVGPLGTGTGVLSRKSELRELTRRIGEHDAEIHARETQQVTYRRQADSLDAPIHALETEMQALSGEAGTLRDQLRDQRQVQERLAGMIELTRQEAGHLEGEHRRADAAWTETARQWDAAEVDGRALKDRLATADAELAAARLDRDRKQEENVAAQVALGRVNEQLSALRERADESAAARAQRYADADALDQLERGARARRTAGELAVLRATAAAADGYARKQAAERDAVGLTADEAALRDRRDRLHAALKELREFGDDHKDRVHARELVARDLTNRRDALTARIREDYGLKLADLLADPTPAVADDTPAPAADPKAVQAEIEELRAKITKLGSVNLEALDELAAVEKRELDLRTQHDDLVAGEKGLMDIIQEINTNSRKLFVETLAVVRGHFQELFRKLFGGGMADIVLEDSDDPLDAGIEVTARPPGKELRNLSLLSGGERTLTAIALLLAIFRSRPSPFCLLDEVDAALDEANTARLAAALGEFLDRSQFIVITHKKRTMAVADVLYGITMQESGVSKQVAVRFEDWPDEADRQAA